MFITLILENGNSSLFNVNTINRITEIKDGCYITCNNDSVKVKTSYDEILMKMREVL